MAANTPPVIFTPARKIAVRQRMFALQSHADAPHYLLDDMVEDVLDRLSFLRHSPGQTLIIGESTGQLATSLAKQGADITSADPASGFDEEKPFPSAGFNFIASLGTLDTVNDLPGALIHIRNALAPGGMMIASFVGAGSLPSLRSAMLAADGDRPSPRLHPQVDVRAGGQLLQRAGFSDAVTDSRTLNVSFRSLDRLVADLRAQALSNVLARCGPPLNKAQLSLARETFSAAGENGRTTERFEILTLSGWRR